jgi:1-acyl-sn-glycerol-3-phosphate acyltransferase
MTDQSNHHEIAPWRLALRVSVLQAVNRLFGRAYHRLEVLSPCTIPARGPAILVCNHTSGLDPQLIQSTCKRLITWMMAKEYYETPVIKKILDTVGVIPVTRSGRDMAATRAAMRALESGQVLGIFPEGKIEPTRELLPFQTGVALLAMKTDAPVVPAYLDGTQRRSEMLQGLIRPQRARLIYGQPMQFDRSQASREGLEAATDRIQQAIATLQSRSDKSMARRDLS